MTWPLAHAVAVLVIVLAGCAETALSPTEAERSPASPTAAPTPIETATPSPAAVGPTASPSAEATPLGEEDLEVVGPIPFTITAPVDWSQGEARSRNAVEVVDGTGLRPVLAVFRKSPATPEEWATNLTTFEGLDAGEPALIEIDGASGVVFDVQPNDSARECAGGGSSFGGRCYRIHGPEDLWIWVIEEGRRARIWILDVNGDTVVMMSDAREDRFDSWAATIDEVVSTLVWSPP